MASSKSVPVSSLRLDLTLSSDFADGLHLAASDAADSPELHRRIAAMVEKAIGRTRDLAGVRVACRPAWQSPSGPAAEEPHVASAHDD